LKRVSKIFLTIAVLATFSIPTLSQAQFPDFLQWREDQVRKGAPAKKITENEQRGTENQPLIVKIQPSKSAQEQTEEDRRDRDKLWYDRMTAWSTFFAAAFALGAFGVAIFQAFFFYRQLGLMREALADTEMAAKAAEESADAAKINAQVAQRSARPFVFLKKVQIQVYPEPENAMTMRPMPDRPNVVVTYENVGREPAILMNMDCRLGILPEGRLPTEYPKPDFGVGGRAIMAAGNVSEERRFFYKIAPSANEYDELRQGRSWFVGFPAVRYQDTAGTEYVRYACFAQHPGTGEIVAVGGDRYNYEEKWIDGKLAETSKPKKEPQQGVPFRPGVDRPVIVP
jgi:hypothetical protein